ncbi:MAG: DUF2752 domain-containing protein [Prolixibacteraceae bacterium]|nr:DUF2752 domain-containing protein [Prolixibacteraceae bacterium]MDD4754535.1 DUF2752 domain-containing protein [Prolixibacteraceae bacterium]NLO01999.1 DUF2752 domain-containing protein [Bacteroidales bacterium]
MKKIYLISLLTGIFTLAGFLYVFDPAVCKIFPPCPFYTITGLYCPGCGSQRALHDILHLDMAGASANNILVIPAIMVFIYHLLCLTIKPKHQNILYHKSSPWIVLGIIIIFWILRNIPVYPFTLLAPA